MDIKRISANSKLIFSKDNGIYRAEGLVYKEENLNYYLFDVQEGNWIFTTE